MELEWNWSKRKEDLGNRGIFLFLVWKNEGERIKRWKRVSGGVDKMAGVILEKFVREILDFRGLSVSLSKISTSLFTCLFVCACDIRPGQARRCVEMWKQVSYEWWVMLRTSGSTLHYTSNLLLIFYSYFLPFLFPPPPPALSKSCMIFSLPARRCHIIF